MGRNARETLHIERRRQQVAELYLQGSSQLEIANRLGISQGTASNDLRATKRHWRESAMRDFDELVAHEMAKLELLEREAWRGWNLSLEPAEATRVVNDGSNKRAEKTVRQQQGDPRYLEQLQRCIAARRALLGLDAPTRIAPTSPDGDESYHVHVMSKLMELAEENPVGPVVIDATYIQQRLEQAAAQKTEANTITESEDRNEP